VFAHFSASLSVQSSLAEISDSTKNYSRSELL
jgi:hypothetical protein